MPVANTKNLQTSILNYLRERPHQQFTSTDLAEFFKASKYTVASRLGALVDAGKIQVKGTSRKGFRYWFDREVEQKAAELPAWARREWKMPSQMMERVQEAQERRAAFPSKYV